MKSGDAGAECEMTDEQKNELENRLTFRDGKFTCVYFAETNRRIGIKEHTHWTGLPQLMCEGRECKDGGPCRNDCPYYAEITMLALNSFRKDDKEWRCRS
jgi:hypothetical protein